MIKQQSKNYLSESQEKINDLIEKMGNIEVLESLVEEMQYFLIDR